MADYTSDAERSGPSGQGKPHLVRREVSTAVHPDGSGVITETSHFSDGSTQTVVKRHAGLPSQLAQAPPPASTASSYPALPPGLRSDQPADDVAGELIRRLGASAAGSGGPAAEVSAGIGGGTAAYPDVASVSSDQAQRGHSMSTFASDGAPEVFPREFPPAAAAAAAAAASSSATSDDAGGASQDKAARDLWLEKRRARKEKEGGTIAPSSFAGRASVPPRPDNSGQVPSEHPSEMMARGAPSAAAASSASAESSDAGARYNAWYEQRIASKVAVSGTALGGTVPVVNSDSEGGGPTSATAETSAGGGSAPPLSAYGSSEAGSGQGAKDAADAAIAAGVGAATMDNAVSGYEPYATERTDGMVDLAAMAPRPSDSATSLEEGQGAPPPYASPPPPSPQMTMYSQQAAPPPQAPVPPVPVIVDQPRSQALSGVSVGTSSQAGGSVGRADGRDDLVSARLVISEDSSGGEGAGGGGGGGSGGGPGNGLCGRSRKVTYLLVAIAVILLALLGVLLAFLLQRDNSSAGTTQNVEDQREPGPLPPVKPSPSATPGPTTSAPTSPDQESDPTGAPVATPPVDVPVTTVPPPAPTTTSPTAPTTAPTQPASTTLEAVSRLGILRCGVPNRSGFGELKSGGAAPAGFSVDMCRAVAAAVFGAGEDFESVDKGIEFVPLSIVDGFQKLANGDVDLLTMPATHTMERDVHLDAAGVGFSFSVPYLYTGMSFGGLPPYGQCANDLDSGGAADGGGADGDSAGTNDGNSTFSPSASPTPSPCTGLRICVEDGTTHADTVPKLLPDAGIVVSPTTAAMYQTFRDGFCNTIAGDQFDVAEPVVRLIGYTGSYEMGERLHSKEPLAIVTRDDDAQWSDFVSWVVQALLAADEKGTTQGLAASFGTTDVFGDQFQDMFINAIATVGNYNEVYERNLQSLVPRTQKNMINIGGSGLIYSHPFGSLLASGPSPISGGTIDSIVKRGHLRCGITRRAGFGEFDSVSQQWSGLDVDYCRALSAALFSGVFSSVVFFNLPATARFVALANGDVDVLSRITTVTLSRDVRESATGEGFSFSQPDFYDGLSFGGIPPFGECADNLDTTSGGCADLRVCVNDGTTFLTRLKELIPERFIVAMPTGEDSIQGLSSGECNAIAGGVQDVSEGSVTGPGGYGGPYEVGFRRFSKDPLALVTKQGDPQWSSFVYWVVGATFYAEENGITQDDANQMPVVELFGPLYRRMFTDAIQAVGSYGEIYARNIESLVPRSGLNLLNTEPFGPQHYPLPGV